MICCYLAAFFLPTPFDPTSLVFNCNCLTTLNISREQTGHLTADILITLESADYKPQVNAELKKQAKQANLPGFRQGKVPIEVIRRMVGKSVVIDQVNKIIGESLDGYIREEELNLLGQPLPKGQKTEEDFDPKAEKTIDFAFEVGLAPALEVNLDLPDMPVRYDIQIDDATYEEELGHFKDRFADVSNPESAEKGDVLFGKIFEADEAGEAVEGGFEQMVPINPERMGMESFGEQLEGATLESVHDIDLFGLLENEEDIKRHLYIDEEVIPTLKDKKLRFQLKRINRVQMAELNPAFFQKVADTLNFDVEEDTELDEPTFKEQFKAYLKEQYDQAAGTRFRNDLQRALIDHHPLAYPDAFLKKWMQESREGYDEARVEAEYGDFTKSLTWSLIVSEVADKEGLQVEEDELSNGLMDSMRRNFAQYGQSIPPDKEKEYLAYALQNREMVEQEFQNQLSNKVFNHLESQVEAASEEITSTAFVEKSKVSEE